jgi:hypothetical protein
MIPGSIKKQMACPMCQEPVIATMPPSGHSLLWEESACAVGTDDVTMAVIVGTKVNDEITGRQEVGP